MLAIRAENAQVQRGSGILPVKLGQKHTFAFVSGSTSHIRDMVYMMCIEWYRRYVMRVDSGSSVGCSALRPRRL
jgi:hypothetical protein